ncbi:MAG: tetratricopeptide repeat protein [Myxococcota bacterium]|nr:tetratricopeptide repeat protein [Myxococcota bacterium]
MLVHLVFAFFINSAAAAPGGDYSLDSNQRQVDGFEKDFKMIQQNYTNRVGLLSAADAEQLFDDGLYSFMFEQYEKAALNFFALQIDKSFQGKPNMGFQSDWYLIESAYLMDNLSTAEQACLKIIERRNHPFFGDAIRRVLEIYGILNQPDKYQEIYNQYVLTGQVEPSAEINYSVGKSLFWQGQIEESKRSLSDIGQDSDLFLKAQYFLGGVHADTGDFESSLENFTLVEDTLKTKAVNDKIFLKSPDIGSATPEEQEIYELSIIAQGRVLLEQESFVEAIEAYSRVPSTSPYYPDVLYELVWAYIKQKQWEDAARLIEVFLVGFPDHDYAIRLKVIQGDIYMKSKQYESARQAYEKTIRNLESVRLVLDQLSKDPSAALALFNSLLQGEELTDDFGLPEYALEMLLQEPMLQSTLKMNLDIQEQGETIIKTEKDVDLLQSILDSRQKLGSFQRERKELLRIRERALRILALTLESEFEVLLKGLKDADKKRVRDIREAWEKEKATLQNILSTSTGGEQFIEAHRAQVRSVQDVARQLRTVLRENEKELTELEALLREKEVPEADRVMITELFQRYDQEVAGVWDRLEKVLSENTTTSIMAYVDGGSKESIQRYNSLIDRMWRIHDRKLAPLWANYRKRDRSKYKETYQTIWFKFRARYAEVKSFEEQLNLSEASEVNVAQGILREQKDILQQLGLEHQAITGHVDAISLDASKKGFEIVHDKVTNNVLRADLGIVKIEWSRLLDQQELFEQLTKEKEEKTTRHKNRFEYIESKFPVTIDASTSEDANMDDE